MPTNPQQPWLSTAPWEAATDTLPAELRGGLTSAENDATRFRCATLKKFLGYDEGPVPRPLRSY